MADDETISEWKNNFEKIVNDIKERFTYKFNELENKYKQLCEECLILYTTAMENENYPINLGYIYFSTEMEEELEKTNGSDGISIEKKNFEDHHTVAEECAINMVPIYNSYF